MSYDIITNISHVTFRESPWSTVKQEQFYTAKQEHYFTFVDLKNCIKSYYL